MMMLKAGMGFGLAVVAALIVGMACGTLTGFFVANFRLSPFIVSMTMQLVYKGIALTITKSTPVAMTHPVLKAINSVKLLDMIPMTFLFFLVLVALSEFVLRKTQFGRNIFLVGGNISVSDNLGIKSSRYVWSAYIIQGLFAALAGIAMMTRTSSANGNIGSGSLLDVIPMVIVGGTSMAGGKGGCIKTLWGVLLLSMVYNAMTFFSIPAPLQPFVKGLILLVVIVSDKYMERRHEKA
jgi:ribose/xylose/arabinose/galactoside ABC-type transport system permease subunit